MILYHGTNCAVRKPDPRKGHRGTDFGQGFYLTPDMESARNMASLVVAREGSGRMTINVFEFDEAAVSGKPSYRGTPREAWDEGYGFWWDLSEVVCLDEPIPCRGNVGMWQMPSALAAQVTAADSRSRMAGEKWHSCARE